MFNRNIYSKWVINSLFEHELITEELYIKCSKPYITGLPGDLRSTDEDLLSERLDAIEEEITRREDIVKRADYRIGVKTRDSERLAKRVEKSIANMDKAVDKIVDESDKIVKSVSKTDFEGKIKDLDSDDKKDLTDAFKEFRKAHNNFFSMDLTGENIKEYQGALDDYVEVADNFNKFLKSNSSFTKADIKNADISANVKRIKSNISKYEKEGNKISKDVQSISDNQRDIDYKGGLYCEDSFSKKRCKLGADSCYRSITVSIILYKS